MNEIWRFIGESRELTVRPLLFLISSSPFGCLWDSRGLDRWIEDGKMHVDKSSYESIFPLNHNDGSVYKVFSLWTHRWFVVESRQERIVSRKYACRLFANCLGSERKKERKVYWRPSSTGLQCPCNLTAKNFLWIQKTDLSKRIDSLSFGKFLILIHQKILKDTWKVIPQERYEGLFTRNNHVSDLQIYDE